MRRVGHAMPREVRWRADYALIEIRPDAHRNHVLRDLFTKANSRIESLRDNVSETVVVDDLDGDIGIIRQQFSQCRQQDRLRSMFDRSDPQAPRRLFP